MKCQLYFTDFKDTNLCDSFDVDRNSAYMALQSQFFPFYRIKTYHILLCDAFADRTIDWAQLRGA